jgi:hypothetical protein
MPAVHGLGKVKRITAIYVHFDGGDPAGMVGYDLVQCPTGDLATASALAVNELRDHHAVLGMKRMTREKNDAQNKDTDKIAFEDHGK